jgi:hypothetical protein
MITQQVSVFLENKSGRLNEVTQILGDAGINISAFTIADTSDFGILRLIVSDPNQAYKVLRQNAFSVKITDVVLARTTNEPGSLSNMLKILSDGGVFIEYMYAFSMEPSTAIVVIRPTNIEKCRRILGDHEDDFLISDNDNII